MFDGDRRERVWGDWIAVTRVWNDRRDRPPTVRTGEDVSE